MLYISREQHKQILALGVLFEICSWPMGQNSELFLSPRVSNTHSLSLTHTHTILVIVWTHTHIIGVVLIIIFFKMSFFPGELKSKVTSCLPFKSNSTKKCYICIYIYVLVQSPSQVWLFGTPWTAVHQASLYICVCVHIYIYVILYIIYRPLLKKSRVGGEGNGTQLQYSCLEYPMDGGAW